MLKIIFEKPSFAIAEEIKGLMRGERRKKEDRKQWGHKERLLVAVLLALTILGSIYFWLKGSGQLPQVSLPKPEFEETIILEK